MCLIGNNTITKFSFLTSSLSITSKDICSHKFIVDINFVIVISNSILIHSAYNNKKHAFSHSNQLWLACFFCLCSIGVFSFLAESLLHFRSKIISLFFLFLSHVKKFFCSFFHIVCGHVNFSFIFRSFFLLYYASYGFAFTMSRKISKRSKKKATKSSFEGESEERI